MTQQRYMAHRYAAQHHEIKPCPERQAGGKVVILTYVVSTQSDATSHCSDEKRSLMSITVNFNLWFFQSRPFQVVSAANLLARR